jgi:hypothetical protein
VQADAQDMGNYAPTSALAEGRWVKVEVGETGVYRLSYADLRAMGFEQPEEVAVYGYGAWIQDEHLQSYIDDLPKIPVLRVGEGLLFFGRGTVKWEEQEGVFVHTDNPYATTGYYFLSDVGGPSPDIEEEPATTATAEMVVRDYDDYLLHERDMVSVSESGRELFGEYLDGIKPLSLTFSIPGIVSDAAGKVSVRLISRPTDVAGVFSMDVGSERLIEGAIIPAVGDLDTKARALARTVEWGRGLSENVTMTLSYSAKSHTNSRLDYLRLQMKRRLQPYGNVTFFRSLESVGKAARFEISGADAATLVFDVTDPIRPRRITATLSGQTLGFTVVAGDMREFALVRTGGVFPTPTKVGVVANQNLHGLSPVRMVIIVPPLSALRTQAERLAEEHRKRDGITVHVVDAPLIYNEFSGGAPDATAYRHFLRMLCSRTVNEAERPHELLLFGDGLFDNRAISGELPSQYPQGAVYERFLLTYQSEESIGSSSYSTDDYFGFLSDENHRLQTGGIRKPIAQWKMDVGVGRLPVRTASEATQVVDKLVDYMDNNRLGTWKNNVCFVADDGNSADNFSLTHADNSNQLADSLEKNHPEFLVNKLFFDAYKKDFSAALNPYPDVRNRLQKLLKSGLLFVNYAGHGGPQSWSDEKVLTGTDVAAFNFPCLPLWITATCDFSPFDATQTSAGEAIMLSASGGVALYSTTRLVYRGPNFTINNQLIKHLFDRQEDGRRMTFGEVFRAAKNSEELYGDFNKLNFILLGDPAMKLAYPEYGIRLTEVNGNPPEADNPFTIGALERVTIEGEILTPDGRPATDFQGDIYSTVLDSKATLLTLDNNNTGEQLSYTDYPNKLYLGNDIVSDGKFRIIFTVPKDIAYSNDFGKINLYAVDTQTNDEAQGAYTRFRVGGTGSSESDTVGPEIRYLYLNDPSFTNGATVNTTPLFVASLRDENGINLSGSSVGHDMTLTIDGRTASTYTLNEDYRNTSSEDGGGIVTFLIPTLSVGEHFAEFVVWDVYNNSTHAGFTFRVAESLTPRLASLSASSNPVRESVEFLLTHDRPGTELSLVLQVYNTSGRLVHSLQEKGLSDYGEPYRLRWNLTDRSGVRLRPGLYFCRAAIAAGGSAQATQTYKLIILAP